MNNPRAGAEPTTQSEMSTIPTVGRTVGSIPATGASMAEIADRLRAYAEDWRFRAASNALVLEAASEIERLHAALVMAAELARTYPEGPLWSEDGTFPHVAHGHIGLGQDHAAKDISARILALTGGDARNETR